jgi:hypothetical protein
MEKCAEEFNQIEMMQMMQGRFANIPNLVQRVQSVLRSEIPNQGTTADGRKQFTDAKIQAVKEIIHLPAVSKDKIYEEFDPVMIFNEMFEEKFPQIVDGILDFQG